jgi:ribosomal-protein-serine acetyltransferase
VAELSIELGGGALLRSYRPDDADAVYETIDRNRMRLARWFPWVEDATDASTQRTWIEAHAGDDQTLAPNGIWVADELAGGCDLWLLGRDDTGEVGFWLDEGFVGRGLVTRAVRALLGAGFDEYGLHRVQLRAGVDNLRSRAVAKRLKMREEGVLRGAGKVGGGLYVDLVMYGLLVDEWQVSR